MSRGRSTNWWLPLLGVVDRIMDILSVLNAEYLETALLYSLRIAFIPSVLMLGVELFHQYVNDPKKTIRSGWKRRLADRLKPLAQQGYKFTIGIIAISLLLGFSYAKYEESTKTDNFTNRIETEPPIRVAPVPHEASPRQREEPGTSSLTSAALMRMVEAGLGDDARSQLGRRIKVQGQVYSIRLLSDTAGPSSTLALLNIEIALEFDHEDYPEKVVDLQVYAEDKEELDKIRVIAKGSLIIASGVIEQIERGFMVLTDGKILAMNRRRVG